MRGPVMNRLGVVGAAALALLCASVVNAQTAAQVAPRVFIEDSLDAPGALNLVEAVGPLRPFPLGVHLVLRLPDDAGPELNRRLDSLVERGLSMWVAVRPPATADGMAAWRSALRELFTRYPGRIAILEMRFERGPDAVSRFALQIASTEARAGGGRTQVAVGADNVPALERLAASLTAADAPYVDLLAAVGAGPHASVFGTFSRAVLNGRLVVRRGANDRDDESPARVVRDVLTTIATDTVATAWPVDDTLADALRALLPVSNLLTHAIEPLDPDGVGLSLGDPAAVAQLRWHRLLFDAETFTTYLASKGEPRLTR